MLDKSHKTLNIERMTIVEVTNQLIGHFCQKDTFSAADIQNIKVAKELTTQKDLLVRAALAELTKMEMVRAIGADLWILSAPLNAGGIDLHLSMPVCNEIADVINTDLEAKGVQDRVDALNIHEGHIVALLQILGEILAADTES